MHRTVSKNIRSQTLTVQIEKAWFMQDPSDYSTKYPGFLLILLWPEYSFNISWGNNWAQPFETSLPLHCLESSVLKMIPLLGYFKQEGKYTVTPSYSEVKSVRGITEFNALSLSMRLLIGV